MLSLFGRCQTVYPVLFLFVFGCCKFKFARPLLAVPLLIANVYSTIPLNTSITKGIFLQALSGKQLEMQSWGIFTGPP